MAHATSRTLTPKKTTYRVVCLAFMAGALAVNVEAAVIPLDSRATYLLTNNDAGSLGGTAVELITLGLIGGDTVRLTQLGDFDCGGPCGDVNVGMIAVFSSSSALLASNQLHRVAGAIDAGADFATAATFHGALATDIAEDFAVTAIGVTVSIPSGATHLFIAARDILYHDNTDPDHDFAVNVEQVRQRAVPEPATVVLLIPAVAALVRRSRRAPLCRE